MSIQIKIKCKDKEDKPIHELRLGCVVIAVADECEALFKLKARMIAKSEIQYAEYLEVFFEGKRRWKFDRKLTKKEALEFLA